MPGRLLMSPPAVQGVTTGPLEQCLLHWERNNKGWLVLVAPERPNFSGDQEVLKNKLKNKYFCHFLNHYIYIQLLKVVLNKTKQSRQDKYECSNTSLKKENFHFMVSSFLSQRRQWNAWECFLFASSAPSTGTYIQMPYKSYWWIFTDHKIKTYKGCTWSEYFCCNYCPSREKTRQRSSWENTGSHNWGIPAGFQVRCYFSREPMTLGAWFQSELRYTQDLTWTNILGPTAPLFIWGNIRESTSSVGFSLLIWKNGDNKSCPLRENPMTVQRKGYVPSE